MGNSGTPPDVIIPGSACPRGAPGNPEADLAWLLHRSAQLFRQSLDEAAQAHGVEGIRAYILLGALLQCETGRTQAVLGQELGLDKTTLASLLDRLEKDGLVVRRVDPNNRRARFPELTEAGRGAYAQITEARVAGEARLLAPLGKDGEALRLILHRLVIGAEGAQPSGSCM